MNMTHGLLVGRIQCSNGGKYDIYKDIQNKKYKLFIDDLFVDVKDTADAINKITNQYEFTVINYEYDENGITFTDFI